MLKELFSMGDYGAYVWPSYVVVLIALSLLVYKALSHKKQVWADLKRRLKQDRSYDAGSI